MDCLWKLDSPESHCAFSNDGEKEEQFEVWMSGIFDDNAWFTSTLLDVDVFAGHGDICQWYPWPNVLFLGL